MTLTGRTIERKPLRVILTLQDYGTEPASTLKRPLTKAEEKWLADHRVGKLGMTGLTVDGHELIMKNKYPGFANLLSFFWDAYTWDFHSLDQVVITRTVKEQSVFLRGKVFCGLYGRFETWMGFEYEIALRSDGCGWESLTLIPDHDTGFSPGRNGPPENLGLSAIDRFNYGLTRFGTAFTQTIVAPFARVRPKFLPLDYQSGKTIFEGPLEPLGLVGLFDPTNKIYFAFLADPKSDSDMGIVLQVDEKDWRGREAGLSLFKPINSQWTKGSRNEFKRWFTAGIAETPKDAAKRLGTIRDLLEKN